MILHSTGIGQRRWDTRMYHTEANINTRVKDLRNCNFNVFANLECYVRILFFFIHLFTYAYIVWAIPPPYPLPFPLSPIPLTSRQSLFCPSLQFCWREDISNNEKDKAFLLVEIRIAIQRDS
jgi:hypothetical protein